VMAHSLYAPFGGGIRQVEARWPLRTAGRHHGGDPRPRSHTDMYVAGPRRHTGEAAARVNSTPPRAVLHGPGWRMSQQCHCLNLIEQHFSLRD
jgi:hypothetical protein